MSLAAAMPEARQLTPENNGGYNVFAVKACQCLRALGSVMVMIVLSLSALLGGAA